MPDTLQVLILVDIAPATLTDLALFLHTLTTEAGGEGFNIALLGDWLDWATVEAWLEADGRPLQRRLVDADGGHDA